MRRDLRGVAMTRWHSPVRDVLVAAIENDVIFGTPLAEFLPLRLCNGRIAIAGDAGRVTSPMVGAGLANGLVDCLALAKTISDAGGTSGPAVVRALKAYESARLRRNPDHVHESLDATQGLLRSVAP
jgi:2-polyprenyl-6-methoxyphenol hydroxylase-like FAD-dependent oxidoreductase